MFISRAGEFDTLEQRYNSDGFEFAVIYGRRRIGKTALLQEFAKNKDVIFFTGVVSNEQQNLLNFSNCITEYQFGASINTCFQDFQTALEYVFEMSKYTRLVLVIDEYPYVARASKSFASTLQMLIDKYKDDSKLFLILCGSSMSYMEDEVLSYKAPLYGRRTMQIKLEALDFFDTCKFLDGVSPVDRALVYGVLGGTPQYILQFDASLSIEDNIKKLFFNSASFLYEEPNNLLKQEVRDPAIYNAIVSAVATGHTKMSEIASAIGEDTSVCTVYLKNLISLGLIRRETPYGVKEGKKSIYRIEDNMFYFWYRFVPRFSSLIARGAADLVYERMKDDIPSYMGRVFEEICKQYMWRLMLSGKCPVQFSDMGRWWGTNSKTRQQEEIDFMGDDEKSAFFAECKWSNSSVDVDVLDILMRRGELFSYNEKHYYLFSKSGYTKECIKAASERKNVHLLTYEDLLKV